MGEAHLSICCLKGTPYPVGGLKYVSQGRDSSFILSAGILTGGGYGNEIPNKCFTYVKDPFPPAESIAFNMFYI